MSQYWAAVQSQLRKLRALQTEAEKKIWSRLRNRQLAGFKFRRQYPIPPYIVDFVCLEARLILEIDGGQHALRQDADERRTAALESRGFQVVRFWNNEVLSTTDAVLDRVLQVLANDTPSSG